MRIHNILIRGYDEDSYLSDSSIDITLFGTLSFMHAVAPMLLYLMFPHEIPRLTQCGILEP